MHIDCGDSEAITSLVAAFRKGVFRKSLKLIFINNKDEITELAQRNYDSLCEAMAEQAKTLGLPANFILENANPYFNQEKMMQLVCNNNLPPGFHLIFEERLGYLSKNYTTYNNSLNQLITLVERFSASPYARAHVTITMPIAGKSMCEIREKYKPTINAIINYFKRLGNVLKTQTFPQGFTLRFSPSLQPEEDIDRSGRTFCMTGDGFICLLDALQANSEQSRVTAPPNSKNKVHLIVDVKSWELFELFDMLEALSRNDLNENNIVLSLNLHLGGIDDERSTRNLTEEQKTAGIFKTIEEFFSKMKIVLCKNTAIISLNLTQNRFFITHSWTVRHMRWDNRLIEVIVKHSIESNSRHFNLICKRNEIIAKSPEYATLIHHFCAAIGFKSDEPLPIPTLQTLAALRAIELYNEEKIALSHLPEQLLAFINDIYQHKITLHSYTDKPILAIEYPESTIPLQIADANNQETAEVQAPKWHARIG